MKYLTGLFFGILACGLLLAQADPRMWGEAGIPIRQALHPSWDETMARDANGNTLLVWSDMRDGDRDLYAQLINSAGDAQWIEDGVSIAPNPYVQDAPVAVAVNGGWIVAWADFRDSPGCYEPESAGCGDIYAQKLDYLGNRLWPNNDWTGVGIDIAERWIEKYSLEIVHDDAGGAIIAWVDFRSGDPEILAQRVLANGSVAWNPVLEVTPGTYDMYRFDAAPLDDGEMVVVWGEVHGIYNDVYASRITVDGMLSWGDGGVPVCTTAYEQYDPQVIGDGSSGAHVLWEDRRSGSFHPALYAQHLQSDGQATWQTNGIIVSDSAYVSARAAIALDWDNGAPQGFLAVWPDVRADGFQSEIYAQKITAQGTAAWAENGVRVSSHPTEHMDETPAVVTDQNGGLVCTWVRRSFSISSQLYAMRLEEDGTPAWQDGGVMVNEQVRYHGQPKIGSSFGMYLIAVRDWDMTGNVHVRFQMLSHTNGSQLLEPEGRDIVVGYSGSAHSLQMFPMAGHRTAMFWEDFRALFGGGAIYYQFVGPFGEIERAVNGEMLAPNNTGHSMYTQRNVNVCDDGSGGLFVVFEDLRENWNQVRMSHLDHSGEVVSPDSGVIVWWTTELGDQGPAFVAPDGEGGCYVAWSGYTLDFWLDLWVMRLDAQLEQMWDEPVRLSESVEDDMISGLVPSADGSCIVSWVFGTADVGFDVKAARVEPDGEITWYTDVCNATGDQENPVMISDGSGGVYVAWSDRRVEENYWDIYAQRIAADGTVLWAEIGRAVCTANWNQNHPQIALDSRGDLIVAWEDFRSGEDVHVYAQKLSPTGELRWEQNGVPVARADNLGSFSIASSEGRDGFLAAWSDYREYYPRAFATHFDSTGVPYDDPFWRPDSGGAVNNLVDCRQDALSAASDGWGGIVVAWQNYRNDHDMYDEGEIYIDLYAQRLFDYASAGDKPPHGVPREYALYQNYPNPFNPVTTIAFDLPQATEIELKVFNLLGREVATLVDQSLDAGAHHVNFDASALPSGLYFYRLEAGTFAQTRKLVLLK